MHLTRYKITYTAQADAVLPGQLGSMIRGIFGETLMANDAGMYQKFFQPNVVPSKSILKYISSDLPAPFIIYPVKRYDFVRQNQEIKFIFTLLGRYRQYENDIFEVFDRIQNTGINQGKLSVGNLQFEQILHNHKETVDFTNFKPPTQKISNLTLQFKTPVALYSKKQLIADFEFQRLFQYVYRRLFVLDQLYGSGNIPEEPDIDLKKLHIVPVDIQLKRQSIFRSPTRNEKYPMTGWKGKITYTGNLNPVIPYLQMGEFLHIGSNTVFGLGKYTIKM